MADETGRPLALSDAIELIGVEPLAYMAACQPDEIAGGGRRAENQRSSLEAALRYLRLPGVATPTEHRSRLAAATSVLTMFDTESGTTVANVLRANAGGALEEINAEGEIEEAIANLARDSFVATLIPPSRSLRSPIADAQIHRNPWHLRFQEAVLAEPDLGERFTGPADGASSSFGFWSSIGIGEDGVQLVLLAERLLSTPAALAWMRGHSAAEFVAAAVQAVAHLWRLVVVERTVSSPALVGLDAVTIQQGTQVESPIGRIRALSGRERKFLGPYAGRGNLVMETKYPVKLSIHGNGYDSLAWEDAPLDELRGPQLEAEERAGRLALAIVLAHDHPMPIAAGYRFLMIEDPFGSAPAVWGRPDPMPLTTPVELTAEQLAEVGEWIERIDRLHHRTMAVALRRTISAVERADPTDAFIDALIAWDSLFGSKKGDSVTFRIAVGLSLLLGASEDERREIKRRATELYALRSGLVHGSVPELPWREAADRRDEAVALLLRALRALYTDDSHLLASGDRTAELVLKAGDVD